jgi:steroid delta-isomerase-like uncharacterized protein
MTPAEVALAYVDALNAHDPDAVVALVTERFVNEHTSLTGRSLTGRAAYQAALLSFFEMLQGLRYEVEDVVADGSRVFVAYTLTGFGVGPDAIRRPISVRGVFRFRIAGDKVAHRIDYWDSAQYEAQVAPS